MRTHFKAILGNTLAELILIIVGIFASVYLPTEWAPYSYEIVWAIVIVATFPIFIMPFIRWFTTTFTLTTKRIITRHGIINKKGHDLPITRISDVAMDRDFIDRMVDGQEFRVTLEDSRKTCIAILAIIESAEKGIPVEVTY